MRRPYTSGEVDAIAAYCPDTDRCYLVPPHLFSGRPSMHLRLLPTRNNQQLRVNWARDYEFGPSTLKPRKGP